MSQAAEDLKPQLATLPAQDRADLAYFLIGSLDEAVDAEAEAAWDAELSRRTEEIRNGQATGEPAGVVFSKLRETAP